MNQKANKENGEAVFKKNLSKQERKRFFSSSKEKVAFSWKPIIKEAKKEGEKIKEPIFDIKIAGWMLDPDEKNLSLNHLSKKFLKKEVKNEEKSLELLYRFLKKEIKKSGLENVYYKIDIPLMKPLVCMEDRGIKIDTKKLKSFKEDLEGKISRIEKKIHKKAGKTFNLNSPKQVGEVLFDDMDLSSKTKTPGGKRSTSEKALKKIENGHPIVKSILKHRTLQKIVSGFASPLIKAVDKKGRVHTTFLQTSTATGRLSSENPNMQNIPRSGKPAKELRDCFVAEKNMRLVSFDYSQLEIRLLAHVSKDPTLTEAIKNGEDIHSLTASRVFGVSKKNVDKKSRDAAKTLNFGVIYGMGPKAFSAQSGLSIKKSSELIEKYFSDFPNIKKWKEETLDFAKKNGYVTNLNGRVRKIKKGWGMERAATNMPIQSLGADIMKIGIIKVFQKIEREGWGKKGVFPTLSIHDELLVEVKKNMLELVIPVIKNEMESVQPLSVPLVVDIKQGKKWGSLKKHKT